MNRGLKSTIWPYWKGASRSITSSGICSEASTGILSKSMSMLRSMAKTLVSVYSLSPLRQTLTLVPSP